MILSRMVYHSERNPSESLDMKTLLASCMRNNERYMVTGMLHFDGENFVQVLEGGRQEVSATYHRIAKDPRHVNPVILSFTDARERLFPQWAMGLHDRKTDQVNTIMLRYFSKPSVDPGTVQVESLLDALQDMAVEIAV